jgi:hypothetical protein
MAEKEERIEKFKAGCRTINSSNAGTNAEFNKNLFNREGEVFVIKRDEATGKLIGRIACCALSPV